MALRAVSICSGIGGLDLALRPRGVRTVCYVERESFPAACLVQAMQRNALDEAPIWSDVLTFDASAWRGRVDIVLGGIPCQPWSCAGKKRGERDERDLQSETMRILDETGASTLFIENVSGFRRALPRLMEELANRGFDAVWHGFRAAEVGAPHGRTRYFVLAANSSSGILRGEQEPRTEQPLASKLEDAGPSRSAGGVEGREEMEATAGRGTPWERRLSPEPIIRGVDDGHADWDNRLRALGNGVVPQQARLAWDVLTKRLRALRSS